MSIVLPINGTLYNKYKKRGYNHEQMILLTGMKREDFFNFLDQYGIMYDGIPLEQASIFKKKTKEPVFLSDEKFIELYKHFKSLGLKHKEISARMNISTAQYSARKRELIKEDHRSFERYYTMENKKKMMAQYIAMHHEGMKHTEIAKALQVSNNYLTSVKREFGITLRHTPTALREKRMAK